MLALLLLLLSCRSEPEAEAPGTTSTSDSAALTLMARCFGELGEGAVLADYAPYNPVVPDHCQGTNHQDIQDVGRVVFLGDSITAGTPPTDPDEYYTALVVEGLEQRFGSVEVADCSEWGAQIDDLVGPQLTECFPGAETEPVLVVFTIGGNDMVDWGGDLADGVPVEVVEADAEQQLADLKGALQWFRDQESTRFPAGVHVVFANVYEYTDSTNDVLDCPLAEFFGVPEDIAEFREGYVAINEAYMEAAVATQTDVLFLFEQFCGHGFHYDDPANPCYRGPDTERWFDDTCIHPTPEGHRKLADMVLAVVDE